MRAFELKRRLAAMALPLALGSAALATTRRTELAALRTAGAVLVLAWTTLGVGGVHHKLYHALLYSVVADRVTRDAASAEDAVQRLQQFVYLNVRTPTAAPALDDSPAETLLRGFAYCDSAQMAFVRLLEVLDVPARVTMLQKDDGTSPHTVAEVYLDGAWRVFDAYYGLAPRGPDGAHATLADLVARPAGLGPDFADPSLFRNAATLWPRTAGSSDPGLLIGLWNDAVRLIPDWLVDRLQDLYLLFPPPTIPPAPFEAVDADGAEDSGLYFKARNYHVFLRAREAAAAYRELLRRYPDSRYADDTLYHLGQLALTQMRWPTSAARALTALLRTHPDSGWVEDAHYFLARADQEAGDCADAAAHYAEVSQGGSTGAENARRRLERLPCG
ncbi:MAG: hypothetical protein HY690_21100 [Chloroflexi bacterium]|nr:hypothetical protein [Chloroflexota bacterium]